MPYYKSQATKPLMPEICTPDLLEQDRYNGWTNWETWNVALWIGNDEFLYREARRCHSYMDFVQRMGFETDSTPDGAKYVDPNLDYQELDEMIDEL